MIIEPQAGEFIFYKSLDNTLSLYKVESVEHKGTAKDTAYHLVMVNSNGTITNKSRRFSTTILDKNGKPRLLRLWVQLEDKVQLVNMALSTGKLGRVTGINPDENRTATIEVTTDDQGWHLLTLKESIGKLQLVD